MQIKRAVSFFRYSKLKSLSRQLFLLLKYAIKYKKFTFNLNTKRYWDENLGSMGDFWRDVHYRHILDMFPADEKFSLLDVGCALGDGCELIHSHFPKAEVTGIDFSEVGIKKAGERGSGVNYMVADIVKDPVPGEYDYVAIVETLEHFDDPYPIVDKLLKHVKKSMIISVPYCDATRKLKGVDWHKYQFNEKAFEKYNCRIVRITEHIEATGNRCIIFEIKP